MKRLEFETSKGRFVVKDLNFIPLDCNGIKLSEITEEQSSEIVFRIGHHSNDHLIPSAKQILHSLLKSKGIHLFRNPLQTAYQFDQSIFEYHQAEQKTFYNPYIFKL